MNQRIAWSVLWWRLLAVSSVLLCPAAAQAHVGIGSAGGLLSGMAHPISGLDHLVAMLAVGLWAAQRAGRAMWLMPLAFVIMMGVGGLLGMAAISLPLVEAAIVASVLVLGLLIAAAGRLPLAASVMLVSLFAVFHGHTHGTEMPVMAAGLTCALGFMASTAILLLCGIGVGLAAQRFGTAQLVRYAGGAIAACGLYLCVV